MAQRYNKLNKNGCFSFLIEIKTLVCWFLSTFSQKIKVLYTHGLFIKLTVIFTQVQKIMTNRLVEIQEYIQSLSS